MRVLFRVRSLKNVEEELAMIEEMMFSKWFRLLDFLFFSIMLTYLLFPVHQSIPYALLIILVFAFIYSTGYYLICKSKQGRTKK